MWAAQFPPSFRGAKRTRNPAMGYFRGRRQAFHLPISGFRLPLRGAGMTASGVGGIASRHRKSATFHHPRPRLRRDLPPQGGAPLRPSSRDRVAGPGIRHGAAKDQAANAARSRPVLEVLRRPCRRSTSRSRRPRTRCRRCRGSYRCRRRRGWRYRNRRRSSGNPSRQSGRRD